MLTAAVWISLNCTRDSSVMICTDSQSLCMALESFNVETSPIRSALHNRVSPVTIQWIPGHSDVPGNDLEDEKLHSTEQNCKRHTAQHHSAAYA